MSSVPYYNVTGILTTHNSTGNYGNSTLLSNPSLCTLKTCDIVLAQLQYIPSLGGNALYAALFALYFIAQIGLGIKFRTWGYMAAMFFGLLLEFIGYTARIRLHFNIFSNNDFLIYLVALTIAPAFLSAAVYFCLSRIVIVYGTHLSWFRPRTYTIIFCSCDFVSLLLQAIGGGIAASTKKPSLLDTGKNIMLAGLGFQIFSIVLFAIAAGWFAFRVWSNQQTWNTRYLSLTQSRLFKFFLVGLVLATLMIFIRSVYRCVELSGGFTGKLFTKDEALFMVLEGVMIVFAGGLLTFLHPGISFQGSWHDVNNTFHNKGEPEKLGSGSASDGSLAEQGAARRGPYPPTPSVPPRPQPSAPYSNQPTGPYVNQYNNQGARF